MKNGGYEEKYIMRIAQNWNNEWWVDIQHKKENMWEIIGIEWF